MKTELYLYSPVLSLPIHPTAGLTGSALSTSVIIQKIVPCPDKSVLIVCYIYFYLVEKKYIFDFK